MSIADQRPNAQQRRRLVAEAGHRGDALTARSSLTDTDSAVRATALGALYRVGELTETELVDAALDTAAEVRRRAAELLANFPQASQPNPPGRCGQTLLELLEDSDETVVEVAAWGSGERIPPEPGAIERLMELVIQHEDALVREAAVAALGAIGNSQALPAILHATRDKATVRRRAVIALAPFEGPEVEAALSRALEDRDWQVRQAAEDQMESEQ